LILAKPNYKYILAINVYYMVYYIHTKMYMRALYFLRRLERKLQILL